MSRVGQTSGCLVERNSTALVQLRTLALRNLDSANVHA